jgi:4-hydroxy-2-oxoheptanedioate aldolase
MTDLPRLNGVIRALEQGQSATMCFSPLTAESALALSGSAFDGILFEGEHGAWDVVGLRDGLQYLLDRARIAGSGSVAPAVTPIVRVPPNGKEMNQFFAKQALDMGAYGIVWPHVSTVEEAYNAVAACRYPRLSDRPLYEPQGIRGDGPGAAIRYWGVSQHDYYARADVWPLAPQGEILVVLMIEDTRGIANLRDMLTEVPGIGAILIGEGDLSQELGIPRQYEHPLLFDAMAEIRSICRDAGVACGHPHVEANNAERVVAEGYRVLISSAPRNFSTLDRVRGLIGRA